MWKCPKCASKVDDDFEVCWNCGTSPDGTEDLTFRTADATPAIEGPATDAPMALRDESPEADFDEPVPELVPCYMAPAPMEAHFIRDCLIDAGAPTVADEQNINMALGGWVPSLWSYGPCVRVQARDIERARAWLAEHEERRRARAPERDGRKDT